MNPTPSQLIREIRLARGLSIAEMAALLGYSSHAVIAWEQGEPVPERVLARLVEMEHKGAVCNHRLNLESDRYSAPFSERL